MNSFEGHLAETPLNQVLVRAHSEARTGVLTLQSDEDIVAISLEGGRIVGADALNETLEEGLGSVLVGEGLVTEAQFEAAVERVSTKEGRIGDILVDEGLISRRDYLAVLRRYTVSLVRRVQAWDDGEFRFYVGEDVAYEEGFEPIRMKELMPPGTQLEGLRDAASVVPDIAEETSPPAVTETVEDDSAPESPAASTDSRSGQDLAGPLEIEPAEPPPADGSVVTADGATDDQAVEALPERIGQWLSEAPDWVARVAPLLVLIVLLAAVVLRPNFLVYPFFWLEPERLELEKQRRTSVYLKIDRAAKTFFLLEGRFPDDLHSLVSRGLLGAEDVVGAGGRILSYLPGDRGYVIRPGAADGTDPGVSKNEAIAGNFFLDPEFVIQPPDRGPIPLVLLD